MADSTTINLFHSWDSSKTLDSIDDTNFVRKICTSREEHIALIREKKLDAEDTHSTIFFVKSQLFLLCPQCNHIYHLHCYLNQDITVELLISTVKGENSFQQCPDHQSQDQDQNDHTDCYS